MTKAQIECELRDLHENSQWPEEIMKFNMTSDLPLCMVNTCFDIDKGLLVKLGPGKEVLAALKGRTKLTDKEIKDVYGSPDPVAGFVR